MYITKITLEENIPLPLKKQFINERILFFDIETTGFSPKTTNLYLIGCIYFENNQPVLKQWFAENTSDEPEILRNFFDFMKDYKLLIHYNGNGFDIPYLIKKCEFYNLPHSFENIESLDLYKSVLPYKKLLKLDSLKQKSIETFLDIQRTDLYSGGELISIYYEYLKNKNEKLYETLLLHNQDDLRGLIKILPVLSYGELVRGGFKIVSAKLNSYKSLDGIPSTELIVTLTIHNPIPKRISFGNHSFYFSGYGHEGKLKAAIYTGELKYFYPNYKDYYYLPLEDTAIHKSVAFYVDKDYRTKAKAATCYSKKTGRFLAQKNIIISPYFKIDYYDQLSYFELTDKYLYNPESLHPYIIHVFELLKGLPNS